jgi:hypothetical protein
MATLYQFAGFTGRRRGGSATPPVHFEADGTTGLPVLTIRLTSRQVVRLTGKPADFRRLAEELLAAVTKAEWVALPEPSANKAVPHGTPHGEKADADPVVP